jgi:N6-L-threonylcarbamoyladenine synthase
MLVYVLNKSGLPLMPCSSGKARRLLKKGLAKVVKRKPFTIQLMVMNGGTTQPIVLGVDSGYSHIGLSAVTDKREVYSAGITLRDDIVKLNSERRQYRRSRRNRKTWYREPRFLNRKKDKGWLAPSIQHKLDSHIKVINQINQILPISKIVVEVASFDIQRIKNPDIESVEYQNGEQKGFWNVREYVLHRDGHVCQYCKGKSGDRVLEVHHLKSRQVGGNSPDNLITLCRTCHKKVTEGKITLDVEIPKGYKQETFMSTVRWLLINKLEEIYQNIPVVPTFGYVTKSNRILLGLEKSHINDAFAMVGSGNISRCKPFIVEQSRRNNRALQCNRKGYKPGIRKVRYQYHPEDLVKMENRMYRIRGVHSYGKYVRISNGNEVLNVPISKIFLVKYQRGFVYM